MSDDVVFELLDRIDQQLNAASHKGLSQVERDVLALALRGIQPSEMEYHLDGVSASAIRKRLGEIYSKFEIRGRGPGKFELLQQRLQSLQSFPSASASALALPLQGHFSPGLADNLELLQRETPGKQQFLGRNDELNCLERWILTEQCPVVAIWGIAGIGKTTLVARFIWQCDRQGVFGSKDRVGNFVAWAYLGLSPDKEPLDCIQEILFRLKVPKQAIKTYASRGNISLQGNGDRQLLAAIAYLLNLLQTQRYLIILDGYEAVFGTRGAGKYEARYKGYDLLLQQLMSLPHRSCLLITSREKPRSLGVEQALNVRTLPLKGLPHRDARSLLDIKEAFTPPTSQACLGDGEPSAPQPNSPRHGLPNNQLIDQLIDLYKGNPLWLKVAATTIAEFFDGSITDFLAAGKLIYDEQKSALKPQFIRLQLAELEVMGWLAINRCPVSLETLQADIFDGQRRADLVYTLRSLERCSLVEPSEDNAGRYGLQPVVLEFATNRLINRIVDELLPLQQPLASEPPGDSSREKQSEKQPPARQADPREEDCFNRYCLVKTDVEEHLQQEQKQAILRPIYEKLLSRAGSLATLKTILEEQLKQRREKAWGQAGYFGGNLLSLFAELQQDYAPRLDEGTPVDFSRLPIWQASFKTVQPERFSFQDCAIDRANFLENLGDVFTLAFNHPQAGSGAGSGAGGEAGGETGPSLLAAGDSNGRVHLWKLPAGQKLVDWQGHQSWVETLAFSDDGRWLATGGDDNYFRLWDLRPEIQSHQGPLLTYESLCEDWVRSLAISRGSDYIAWSSGSQVWVHRLEQRSRLSSTQPWITISHLAADAAESSSSLCVRAVTFSDDGKWLATGGDDHLIRIWDFEKICATAPQPPRLQAEAFLVGALQAKHQGWVRALAFSPQGDRLVSSSDDGTVQRWQLHRTAQGDRFVPEEPSLKDHCERVRAIAIEAGGRLLASGGDDGQIRLWDLQNGQARSWQTPELALSQGRIWAVAFSQRQGRPLLAWGDDAQTIRLLELSLDEDSASPVKATLLRSLQGHTSSIRSAVFIPNFKTEAGLPWIVSGGDSHVLQVWETQADAASLERLRPAVILSGHQGRIWQLAYHPETKILASASDDKTIRLWNIATQDCLQILTGHTYWVRTVAFSPSGLTLASAGDDETIRLWDVRSGVQLHTLGDSRQGASLSRSPQRPGHNHWIRSIAFSPDGRTLASGGDGRRVLLWDLAALETNPAAPNPAELPKPSAVLQPQAHRIRAIAFSHGGQWLASADDNGDLLLWRYPDGLAAPEQCWQHHRWGVKAIAFSPCDSYLVTVGDDQTIYFWDLVDRGVEPMETLRSPAIYGNGRGFRSVSFSADGRYLVTGDREAWIELWQLYDPSAPEQFEPQYLGRMTPPRPYEGMNITHVTGLDAVQRAGLKALGAIEHSPLASLGRR